MTQVSWRRILERAEGGAPVVNLHDRAPGPRDDPPARKQDEPAAKEYAGAAFDLESQLEQAMRRRKPERLERDATGRRAEREPVNDKGDTAHVQTQRTQRRHPPHRTPPPVPPQKSARTHTRTHVPPQRNPLMVRQDAKKLGKGGRNLLAVTLSLAVIGLAVYQIRTQWRADIIETAPTAQISATEVGAAVALRDEPAAGAQQNQLENDRTDFPPSLASDNGRGAANQAEFEQDVQDAVERLAADNDGSGEVSATLNQDIERAATLFSQSYKERTEANETKTSTRSAAIPGEDAASILANAEQTMLQRGYELINQGDIAGARLVFESLAEQNSALGAFALAQTYDANFLQSRRIAGVKPDDALAAKWYQHAGELTTQGGTLR